MEPLGKPVHFFFHRPALYRLLCAELPTRAPHTWNCPLCAYGVFPQDVDSKTMSCQCRRCYARIKFFVNLYLTEFHAVVVHTLN